MTGTAKSRTVVKREDLRPHVAEWFGHRVFPVVADGATARRDQQNRRCPFLSGVAESDTSCVKNANSLGVCTISAGSNGFRQDWLVCPYRALDDQLFHAMVRRLFDLEDRAGVHVVPVTNLANEEVRERFLTAARDKDGQRQFLTFQQLFGGEIGLPSTGASPELSFDVTVVEVVPADDTAVGVRLGRYGVIEMQTTDTHGTYRYAVEALRGALDLHGRDFGAQVAAHPDWSGRRVEGPNISNVFKRTFYQIMFKFQITRRASSAGCILAVPRPVWDSWQPFLGAPEVIDALDGTQRLRAREDAETDHVQDAPNWIYVFDITDEPPKDGQPTPISVQLVVATDTATLSRLALDIAPKNAIGSADDDDSVVRVLRRRTHQYVPGIE